MKTVRDTFTCTKRHKMELITELVSLLLCGMGDGFCRAVECCGWSSLCLCWRWVVVAAVLSMLSICKSGVNDLTCRDVQHV